MIDMLYPRMSCIKDTRNRSLLYRPDAIELLSDGKLGNNISASSLLVKRRVEVCLAKGKMSPLGYDLTSPNERREVGDDWRRGQVDSEAGAAVSGVQYDIGWTDDER